MTFTSRNFNIHESFHSNVTSLSGGPTSPDIRNLKHFRLMGRSKSYFKDSILVKRARSKKIENGKVSISEKLENRLESINHVFDFGIIYLNKEVARMPAGTPFGDLALMNNSDTRAASIRMTTETFLAYLDKTSYNQVMKKVIKQNTQQKMAILRSNEFFSKMSIKML